MSKIMFKVRVLFLLTVFMRCAQSCARPHTLRHSFPILSDSEKSIERMSTPSMMIQVRGGDREINVDEVHAGLRPRASYHLARKAFHLLTIMGFATTYSATHLSRRKFAQGVIALDGCVLVAELVRLRLDAVNKTFLRMFGAFMRVHELTKFSGIMYCLAGLGVTAAMCPKHIALLGMLQLALGDPTAALFGHATRSVRWSRLKSGKGLLGALGCAWVLTIANSVALSRATFNGPRPPFRTIVAAGALMAIWTAFVELSVPSPQKTLPFEAFPLALDDNAILPVLGAVGAAVVFRCLDLSDCQLRPWILV